MNQLARVSQPLYFLLLLFRLRVFQALRLSALSAGGGCEESICLADTLPPSRIHSAGKPM